LVSESTDHRLVAVLSADAVGYSRLMGADEAATVRMLDTCRRRIENLIETFRGRLVDAPGDNFLAEFPSAVGSVRCAIEIQRALAAENERLAPDRRMPFRIGIHLGDVMVDGSKIYGDGVNIAARLEGLAEPGAICVSDVVYQQIRRRLNLVATDLGERRLKNIEVPVRAYQLGSESLSSDVPLARAAAPVVLSPPDRPSLAVLPFYNMSGDRSQDYFSDGLTMDILERLVKLPGLFLISQASAYTYKGVAAKPRQVAQELGVRHVLEGAVRREQQRVRITAQLIEGASGRLVWAERYDRDLEDVFAVQDEITDEVVTALDVALVRGEEARITRQHLRDPEAVLQLYRGRERLDRFTRADMAEARRLFEEVVRLAPACPWGYADVAWTHYFDVERGWSDSPIESLESMSRFARRALELGDVTGHAHLMFAHTHLMKREHDEALAVSDVALEQRPSCQGAYGLKANILNYCARPQEAIAFAQQAIRLSPVAQPWFPEVLSTAYYLCGRFEEAIQAANQALALAPDSVDARVVLTAALVATGRLESAKEAGREILSLEPRFTLKRFSASQPYRDSTVLEGLVNRLQQAGLPYGEDLGSAKVVELAAHAASRRRVAPRPRR
jgi:adenylate cyclase